MITFELLFLPLTSAVDLDLLLALTVVAAGPRVADEDTAVAALHLLGTLVLAAQHCLPLALSSAQILPALDKYVSEAAVTLHLDIGLAVRAGREVAGQRTGMFASLRSLHLAPSLTLLTVDARTEEVRSLPHLVAVPLTVMVTTCQASSALSTARGGL